MTDTEKRAHDLAVMYTQYQLYVEANDPDNEMSLPEDDASVYDLYSSAYENFLDNLNTL